MKLRTLGLLLLLFVLTLAGGAYVGYEFYQQYNQDLLQQHQFYLKQVRAIERGFIEHLPIYEDYASPKREQALRRYLLKDHLKAVRKMKVAVVANDAEIEVRATADDLVAVKSGTDALFYFYNVPQKYRYLTPQTAKGLELVVERFQANLKQRFDFPAVKLAISSALRPVEYQSRLRGKNRNASLQSTHSYGVSFDIFYDDYYVSPPPPVDAPDLAFQMQTEMRTRFGFLLGDALRRQLRSILMETLLQLQGEGRIYAILEKSQRCYHITVLL